MTTYLRYTFSILLLGIASIAIAQSAEKTLVKSFPVETQAVSLNLVGATEVKIWENDLLRVQMTVTLYNGNEAILKSLISAGRYNLVANVENGQTVITLPAMEREVQIGGKALRDDVTFVIYAPKNVSVKLPTANSTSSSNTVGGSSF
ncbi:MAG: hypothetical protein ACK4TA_12560 [Saprospiraceae bacterium]